MAEALGDAGINIAEAAAGRYLRKLDRAGLTLPSRRRADLSMNAGRVRADGDPRSVLTIRKTLRLTNITPPQVAVFGSTVRLPGVLTVAEAVEASLHNWEFGLGISIGRASCFCGTDQLAPGQGGV